MRTRGTGDGKGAASKQAKKLKISIISFLQPTQGWNCCCYWLDDDDDVYVCTYCSKNLYFKRSQSSERVRELKNSSSTPPMSHHKSS